MGNWGFLIAVVSLIVIVNGENGDVRQLSRNKCKEMLMDQIRRECGVVYRPTREALSRHHASTLFKAGEAGDMADLASSWTSMQDDQQSQQLSERVKRIADQLQVWEQCCQQGHHCKLSFLCSDDSE